MLRLVAFSFSLSPPTLGSLDPQALEDFKFIYYLEYAHRMWGYAPKALNAYPTTPPLRLPTAEP